MQARYSSEKLTRANVTTRRDPNFGVKSIHDKPQKPKTKLPKAKPDVSDIEKYKPESRNMILIVDQIKADLAHSSPSEFRNDLRDYCSHCCESAAKLLNTNDIDAAAYILKQCETYVKHHASVASSTMLYNINSQMANLANRKGNVKVSLLYLTAAFDAGNDERLTGQHALPIGETLLNMVNAHSYLGNYNQALKIVDQAYGFAGKVAWQLEGQIRLTAEDDIQTVTDLKQRLESQMQLMVMARHAKGTVLEKTNQYGKAIAEYKAGQKMAEDHFGAGHTLVTTLSQSLGGATIRGKQLNGGGKFEKEVKTSTCSNGAPKSHKRGF